MLVTDASDTDARIPRCQMPVTDVSDTDAPMPVTKDAQMPVTDASDKTPAQMPEPATARESFELATSSPHYTLGLLLSARCHSLARQRQEPQKARQSPSNPVKARQISLVVLIFTPMS